MSTHDNAGRPWATVAEVKAGTVIEVDGDFTCIPVGEKRTVHVNQHGDLCVVCDVGEHTLDGQYNEEQTCYVGMYIAQ